MFDYLRNITKSAEEKRQERLNAYLDDALSERDRRQFEQELARDPALRADLDQLRWVKRNVQQLPRVRAPRNFILDPAVYGQRATLRASRPSWQPYPALRLATALTAFFFVLSLALDLATPFGALSVPGAATSQIVAEEGAGQEETLRQADEQAQEVEPEAFEEEPVEEAASEEEAAEVAPLAAPEETDVAEVAEEAAADVAAAGTAVDEELETLEAAQEEGEADEPAAPGAGAPSDATKNATGATNAAEATATAEIAALSPQASPQPQATQAPADEDVATLIVTETAQITEAPPVIDEGAQRVTEPFPYLLAVEIALGVILVGLLMVMLIVRRDRRLGD